MSEREQADLSEAEGHDSKTLFGPLDVDEQSKAQPYDVVLLVPCNLYVVSLRLRRLCVKKKYYKNMRE